MTSRSAFRLWGATAIGAVALTLATGAQAQVANMVGSWQGTSQAAPGATFNLVVNPQGGYSEQVVGSGGMTLEQGVIQQAGDGVTINFEVQDWAPKTLPVYHPNSTLGPQGGAQTAVGGYYTDEQTPKPPGGTWHVQFNGANAFSMQDVNFGGVVYFQRVQ